MGLTQNAADALALNDDAWEIVVTFASMKKKEPTPIPMQLAPKRARRLVGGYYSTNTLMHRPYSAQKVLMPDRL